MDRIMGYGLVGTIGLSASTIASAIVGEPIPVVVPSIAAAAVIAAHHVRENENEPDEATDEQVEQAVASVENTRVYENQGQSSGDPLASGGD